MASKKEQPEIKRVLETIFLKPTDRRHRFLYGGITKTDAVYIMGTLHDSDFGASAFRFGISFIHIKDTATKNFVSSFLDRIITSVNSYSVMIDMRVLGSVFNKIKWDIDKVYFYSDITTPGAVYAYSDELDPVLVTTPYQFFYTKVKLCNIYNEFTDVIFGNTKDILTYDYVSDNKKPVQPIIIEKELVEKSPLGLIAPTAIRFPLLYGIDLLAPFSLENTTVIFSGLLFWSYSDQALRYCYSTVTEHVDIFSTRANLYLFPSTDS